MNDDRTIESLAETATPNVYLSITTTHSNKRVIHAVTREHREQGIVSFSIVADTYGTMAVPMPRYNAKAMASLHGHYLRTLDLPALAAWAAEKRI